MGRSISDKLFYRNATTHAFNFIVSSMKFNVFGRLVGVGEINKYRLSYRNHYMCSGEATSKDKMNISVLFK